MWLASKVISVFLLVASSSPTACPILLEEGSVSNSLSLENSGVDNLVHLSFLLLSKERKRKENGNDIDQPYQSGKIY